MTALVNRLQEVADKSRAVAGEAASDFRYDFSFHSSKDTGCITAVPTELTALAEAIGRQDYPDSSILLPDGTMPGAFCGRKYVMQDHGAYVSANDNRRPLMIGITGERNVGKSTVATLLESQFGFVRIHAFDGGKEAAVAYFEYVTGSIDIANEMVYGDLKDRPCTYLPGAVAPRFFLEKFGKFMGVDMGIDWTLAMEIERARRLSPVSPIVVESLVYEAPWFKAQGGFVLRLVRPGHQGPDGVESDAAQAGIEADATIEARSVAELEDKALRLVDGLVGSAKWAA